VNRSKPILKIELTSDPQMLCVVRAALEHFTAVFGLCESEVRSVVLAVDEALTNIIRHAYHGQPDKPIEVSCRRIYRQNGAARDPGLEIVLIDRGTPANPKKMQSRPLDEVRPGGLGLHFIKKSMDIVEYKHIAGGNRLRLVKFLTPQPQTREP
jgi:anti-sigma regulatory factor (Ser/Thr protein kinase)